MHTYYTSRALPYRRQILDIALYNENSYYSPYLGIYLSAFLLFFIIILLPPTVYYAPCRLSSD
jgi:hypothetical protein